MTEFSILVNPIEETIRERASAGLTLTCPIYIRCGECAFPNESWDDFAVVILGWWMEQVRDLHRCQIETAVLLFMDGPYRVHISSAGHKEWMVVGVLQGLEDKEFFREICSTKQIIEEIVITSRDLLNSIRSANVWDVDCAKLDSMVNLMLDKGKER
jgi:hypothetical protein